MLVWRGEIVIFVHMGGERHPTIELMFVSVAARFAGVGGRGGSHTTCHRKGRENRWRLAPSLKPAVLLRKRSATCRPLPALRHLLS